MQGCLNHTHLTPGANGIGTAFTLDPNVAQIKAHLRNLDLRHASQLGHFHIEALTELYSVRQVSRRLTLVLNLFVVDHAQLLALLRGVATPVLGLEGVFLWLLHFTQIQILLCMCSQ